MSIKTYQDKVISETSLFRQDFKYPVYPPYHNGKCLEDRFFDFYIKKGELLSENKIYLPVFWTTVYNDSINGVQEFLNSLDNDYTYTTVCQHDDAVREKLPSKTVVYSAGGNKGGIPIPLVCSPIPKKYINFQTPKKYLASFVGSLTHPIRNQIVHKFSNDSDFFFGTKNWNPNINQNELELFFNITQQSKFSLCPRGYGLTSFRLYESIQLNSVPVYISDNFWLPFTDKIDWEKICVIIKTDDIPNIKNILESITEERYNEMLQYGKDCWTKYFEIDAMIEYLHVIINKK